MLKLLKTKLRGILKGRRNLKFYLRLKFKRKRNKAHHNNTAIQNETKFTKVINLVGNNKKSLHQFRVCNGKKQKEKNLGGMRATNIT